ncbi:hypothetical protein SBADM41S_09016 [Streptomyces badius]
MQSRALAAKRADVVAKVAPELPEILGDGYRAAFLAYAGSRPLSGGYRRDALDFAEHVLITGGPADPVARRRLTSWWQDRSGTRPPRRTTRLVRGGSSHSPASRTLTRKSGRSRSAPRGDTGGVEIRLAGARTVGVGPDRERDGAECGDQCRDDEGRAVDASQQGVSRAEA